VSGDRVIVLNPWITIEILVPPTEDENSGTQEDNYRNTECDAQRGNASLFNYGNEGDYGITDYHAHFDFRNGVGAQSCFSSPIMMM